LGAVEQWSAEHLAALAVTVAVAAFAGSRAWPPAVGRGLAVVILAAYGCEQLTYALRGTWSVEVNLPLHLTDAVTLASVVALWRRRPPLLVEVVYLWALSASLQAVLTPDLGEPFPDVLFLTYFLTHSGAIAAACLLVLGPRRPLRRYAVPQVFAVTAGFACLAALGTVLTGGNYMFLRHKPANDSLLDVMGPWPVYIAVAAVLALGLFVALAAVARRIAVASGHADVG
jgi:hypothetical integral membrane protein (TIGR02206 family)